MWGTTEPSRELWNSKGDYGTEIGELRKEVGNHAKESSWELRNSVGIYGRLSVSALGIFGIKEGTPEPSGDLKETLGNYGTR